MPAWLFRFGSLSETTFWSIFGDELVTKFDGEATNALDPITLWRVCRACAPLPARSGNRAVGGGTSFADVTTRSITLPMCSEGIRQVAAGSRARINELPQTAQRGEQRDRPGSRHHSNGNGKGLRENGLPLRCYAAECGDECFDDFA
jgi:hypothetical protein